MYKEKLGVKGVLSLAIITPDPDAAIISGLTVKSSWVKAEAEKCYHRVFGTCRTCKLADKGKAWVAKFERNNAFLNQGVQAILDRYAGLGAVAVPSRIAVSSDNTAVTATSTTFGGTFRSSTMNATFPSRTVSILSFQSDFTKGAGAGQIDFSVRKLGVTNASTDAVGAVQDIIGGSGSSPYNEPLTIDLTSTTSFTFRPQIDITLVPV